MKTQISNRHSSFVIRPPAPRLRRINHLSIVILAATLFSWSSASAFCGFYVAKADASLFNKTSQVILVRNGDRTTITMSSDFEGSINDFAMVVPVPVVLKRNDIKTVGAQIFQTLGDYSAPRLSEYYDDNPCQPQMLYEMSTSQSGMADEAPMSNRKADADKKYNVTIEAQYTVDEYDILILSATESNGLEHWLTDNGYKIPEGAKEVLQPYIRSGMKFFVVKVNTAELKKKGTDFLSPLQISFNSPKFMLPIRLGMANAKGSQDMIVYAFTQRGRIETTNYRTVEVPTGNEVPEFVQNYFGKFYVDTYRKHRRESGRNNVYVEYAWDISGSVTQFCDPCNGAPPMLSDLMTLGVDWVQNYHNGYQGDVFFTRLHVTYDRKNFPQDLMFEETPNRENFQAIYTIRHPVYGQFDCAAGKKYVQEVMKRRNAELQELAMLTDWDVASYADYATKFEQYVPKTEPKARIIRNRTPKMPDPLLREDHDTVSIKQESFNTPFYFDDDSNNSSSNNNLMIVTISTLLLLVVMTVIARAGKTKEKTLLKKLNS